MTTSFYSSKICRSRTIGRLNVATPLLVPSFSSVARGDIGRVHHAMARRLGTASLVSAYDIHHKNINRDDIWQSEVLFVDSGTFENQVLNNASDTSWSKQLYTNTIESLVPLSRIVITNYDFFGPLGEQISDAEAFFGKYSFAKDFLCKPATSSEQLNGFTLAARRKDLAQFDIIGVTERELGFSLEQKCKTLAGLRWDIGSDTPIHVFGCLDPLSIIAFFICGADIFDGLSWLTYGFLFSLATYHANYSLMMKSWKLSEARVHNLMWAKNLQELRTLRVRMSKFASSHNLNDLELEPKFVELIKGLMKDSGVLLEG